MEKIVGLYVPTEEEQYNCVTGHSSCEYGICSECSVGREYLGEDNDEDETED